MASRREQVILGVLALITGAMPAGAKVIRNASKPETIPPQGAAIVSDGEPGEPEVTFSPTTYIYEHRIPVEVAVTKTAIKTAETVLDETMIGIGAAIDADRTLGGLCDYVLIEAPITDELEATGAVTARWAEIGIVAVYGTTNPLT